MFELHPQLQHDCFSVTKWPLNEVLLMNDSQYPWCILVPARENITEIYELSQADQQQLMLESSKLARILSQMYAADKINIAALGNVVPQLHIHHIVRYKTDIAWPAPVWGKFPAKPYIDGEEKTIIEKFKSLS